MLPMNQRPSAVIRDESGFVVPSERWSDEQCREARASIVDQFRHGIQRHTLEEIRDEMAARRKYVEPWEEEQAVREWIQSQLDGLMELDTTGQINHQATETGRP